MKKIILFGIGNNGKKMVEAYSKYDKYFEFTAIADNCTNLLEYMDIPVISPKEIQKFSYDEIWISTIYHKEIEKQLVDEYNISPLVIRYVEYPMPFIEKRIYDRYQSEIAGIKKCGTRELQDVIDYVVQNGVRMYCYPFYDEYGEKDFIVDYDEENQLFYGMYLNHRMYLSKQLDTLEKAKLYFRYVCMEQDERSPHCYLTENFKVVKGEIGIDVGAAEGIFALSVLDRAEHIYLIEADENWCKALALTFRDYTHKVTIIQGYVSYCSGQGQLVLDDLFHNTKIDFIKMDIEGAEMQALHGAEKLIAQHHPKLAVCTYHNAIDNEQIGTWALEKGVCDTKFYWLCNMPRGMGIAKYRSC